MSYQLKFFADVVKAIVKIDQRPGWKSAWIEFDLHPAVEHMLNKGYKPENMHLLALQWPHESETDPNRLAYIQSMEKADRNLFTVTSVPKYLHRHFPTVSDHEIRDIAEKFGGNDKFHITDDMDVMLDVITNSSVYSCMCNVSSHKHPYNAYCPKLGWGLAYRESAQGELLGRAVVHRNMKIFVRTYQGGVKNRRNDKRLEVWLEARGYSQESEWPFGTKLALIYDDHRLVAPYLDGGNQKADLDGNYLVIRRYGDYTLTEQDGYLEDDSWPCEDCGARTAEDDLYSVEGGDSRVCGDCIENYTLVQSRYGEEYIASDRAVECVDSGDYYDSDNLPRSVEMLTAGRHEGKVCDENDAVFVKDEIYHVDDITTDIDAVGDKIIETHSGDYVCVSDAFQCLYDLNIYSKDDDDYVEVDDGYVLEENHEEWLAEQAEFADETQKIEEVANV